MRAPLRVAALACLTSLAGLAAISNGLSQPDRMIERSYAEAFDRLEQTRGTNSGIASGAFDPAYLHLSRLPATAPIGPSLAVGDRITLAQRTGGTANYEIIDVKPLPGVSLGESGPALPSLMMVTAVTSGQLPGQTIRFIIDADGPTSATVPKPMQPPKPHAL